jgi:hypothetical protein
VMSYAMQVYWLLPPDFLPRLRPGSSLSSAHETVARSGKEGEA